MPTITGTNGNDNLSGTAGSDTINPLLGKDIVDGLGDSDTLIVDYSSAPIDPYAGASIADVPSVIYSNGGSFSGAVRTVDGGNYVNFSNIEHLQVKLDFWQNTFILDGSALAQGATILLDGGNGTDTLEANLSALASVDLEYGPGGTTASFGTIISFEAFRLNLTEGADHVTTGAGKDRLTGNGGDDVLNSGAGDDILSGGSGSNSLTAGDGSDEITSAGIDTVDGGGGYDRWTGDYGSSTANLTFIRDSAAGTGTLNNGTTLTGIEQVSSLTTGSGNDVFTFSAPEAVSVSAGAGEDTLNLTGYSFSGEIVADGSGAFRGFLGYDRFSGIEHLNFVSNGLPDMIALDAAPLLSGATLSLDAGGGVDAIDVIAIDFTAFGAISFVVAANSTVTTNVPSLTLVYFEAYRIDSGAAADNIATGGGDDVIHANGGNDIVGTAGGNDVLDGGLGADSMTGGAGNDLYYVDEAGDVVIEDAGGGSDRVIVSLSYALDGNLEVETLEAAAGTAAINLTGNYLAQTLVGNVGNNILHGGGGADILRGFGGDDTYYADVASVQVDEFAGNGTDRLFVSVSYALAGSSEVEVLSANNHAATAAINLTGSSFGQTLIGNAGENILHGGGGTDLLIGLGGRDIYYVDVASTQIVEYEGGGNDALYVSVSYTLVNGEIEVLSTNNHGSTSAINLTGNLYSQTLIGNAGKNVLNGGGGTDLLIGLAGNDIYYVDVAATQVIEYESGGSDTLYVSLSYTLGGSAAVETLSVNDYGSTLALNLTGNLYAQTLIGNAGNNVLNGGGGVDSLIGLGGNDIYYVDVLGTQVSEGAGAGTDAIYTSVSYTLAAGSEVEILSSNDYGATSALILTGNAFAQVVTGNAGANTLNGGAGADTLHGLGGADNFAFTTALGGGNIDAIADFSVADDTIQLDDAIFAAIGPMGTLNPNAFATGAAAADADDRIVYDAATGQLFYDADGNGAGAAVQFATLASGLALTANDFQVI
jgi:Ca2+-binding RTX toxin-like protein